MLGSVTRQNICQPLAPNTKAASSSSVPWDCINGITSRATKGKVTKIVANTMPGNGEQNSDPMVGQPRTKPPLGAEHEDKHHARNNRRDGKGRSINVIRKLRPGKRNRAMAQEAANPKTKLAGTAMTAAMSVSFMAERATGSTMARAKTPAPLANALTKTERSGTTKKSAKNPKATPMAIRWTQRGSVRARRDAGAPTRVRGEALPAIISPPTNAGSTPEAD
jgi:hypothetical protein